MQRPGCLALSVSAAVLLALLGWGAKSMLDSAFGPPDDHVAATDSRVCPQTDGNNLSFYEATGHFGLAVPPTATNVVFTATVGGLQGESSLELRFTTTPGDLAALLTASRFEPPSGTTRPLTGGWTGYTPRNARPTGGGPLRPDPAGPARHGVQPGRPGQRQGVQPPVPRGGRHDRSGAPRGLGLRHGPVTTGAGRPPRRWRTVVVPPRRALPGRALGWALTAPPARRIPCSSSA